ncbi:guanylyl cyclase [Halioglobus japonicus]|uniref:Guanylyl cyclase n=1 Tax=Halioglobus japonicus TaxID=930805 RepID=A0AAP8SNE5_9GAMM|nr:MULTISPECIES: heme NO-binding domain-containing protein [Halioglobus]MCH2110511.1 heme NO-binding domain-containing protein [Polyangiaceae bacterium]AQA18370.1 guanylyl cyclase [Halioglobus japonicus]KZX55128.1 guanylyl cyclase [Halioglobus sp. HI00S01]PLW86386.1 guanylyl cyclase [Halioglobus japonicus]GHD13147.1 hypothetical protein GCM10007052_14950 [Halioglobus japonicus]
MYGLINKALQSMILQQFGEQEWSKVLEHSGMPEDSFLTMRHYDDEVTYKLVGAASEVLGAPIAKCLEMFGEYWVLETASKSYGTLMDASGDTMVEFLSNMNSLHDRITGTFLDYVPPEFMVEDLEPPRYRIHYMSKREGLVPFVDGLLKGLAIRFDADLEIHSRTDQPTEQGTHAVYEVSVS